MNRRLMIHVLVGAITALGISGAATSAQAATGDRKPPTVSIATPAPDATAEGVLLVSGSASDNIKVSRVAVGVDGGQLVTASGTTSWSMPVNSASYGDGSHAVKVKAWDKRGNVSTKTVSVTFDNASEPASNPGPSSMTTPEGTKIEVDSAGAWTATQIAAMLQRNGLDDVVGPHLTVKVQDVYASQVSTSTTKSNGVTTGFTAVMYLKGVNSTFAAEPESTLAHEYGHAWSLYHLAMSRQGDWSSYLQARGLAGDDRLDSSYTWGRNEIIADDFRLLFGSDAAIAGRDAHLNADISDPRDVQGLKAFLADGWTA